MHCTGAHVGAVEVVGPASVNTAAPLVCADESATSCLSGYVDMPSCLADIATGMASCFVYLQQDATALGTVAAGSGQYYEVHGQVDGETRLRLQTDWTIDSSAAVVLADMWLQGGDGNGCQLTVESGGRVALQNVQMQDSVISFAGTVSVTSSLLSPSQITGTGAAASLALSGGTLEGTVVSVSLGTTTVGSGCVLTDSPLSISGEAGSAGTLAISNAEL
eukprot:SAG22_NODE_15_length_32914_cov_20.713546_17_plen_220_part_00